MMPPELTIAQAAYALARIPAQHHPGERFTYGFNTDLLGRLIEVWSVDRRPNQFEDRVGAVYAESGVDEPAMSRLAEPTAVG